jgi:transposase
MRLMTHPGVGSLTALAYVLIIGTPTRFQRGKQIIGTYVGMIPCEKSSARKQRLGHIGKQGNSLLGLSLMEAAQAAARVHPDWRLGTCTWRCVDTKALPRWPGRHLAVWLYWMWRNGCEYSPALEFGSYAGQLGTGDGVSRAPRT